MPDKKAISDVIFAKEFDIYAKRKATFLKNETTMFVITYRQCSEATRAKLEDKVFFKEAATDLD
eukprot:2039969-Ditylum_brightwellii.AAC.1